MLDTDEGATCTTCGEYAEDGSLCDRCVDIEQEASEGAYRDNLAWCQFDCKGKIHHATEASADEHAASLGGDAYSYECDCPSEWLDDTGKEGTGPHWHVAGSPIPRKWREWVDA